MVSWILQDRRFFISENVTSNGFHEVFQAMISQELYENASGDFQQEHVSTALTRPQICDKECSRQLQMVCGSSAKPFHCSSSYQREVRALSFSSIHDLET